MAKFKIFSGGNTPIFRVSELLVDIKQLNLQQIQINSTQLKAKTPSFTNFYSGYDVLRISIKCT